MAEKDKIKRAIISVSDKNGIIELAQALQAKGVEVVSTGGTKKILKEAGIKVVPVSSFTGEPEILAGRVKTLHPKIAAGILFRRNIKEDHEQMDAHDYKRIDLVVVNLYPFEETVARGASDEETIENIDIGGSTLVRAAAKNFTDVVVLSDPSQYSRFLEEFGKNDGATTLESRRQFAAEAYKRIARYDDAIDQYFTGTEASESDDNFPQTINISLEKVAALRYGENPHQQGALSRDNSCATLSLADARQLSGKELSYNNYGDLDAVVAMIADFKEPFVCVVKHANPCGAAVGENVTEAYREALASDPMSAFGSIIGLNRVVDMETALLLHQTQFVECIIAPGYDEEAFAKMKKKKARRLLELPGLSEKSRAGFELKYLQGGFLRQSVDSRVVTEDDLTIVSKAKPTTEQIRSLLFAFRLVKHVKSNAILIVQKMAMVGFGCGQTSRVDAVENAVKKAGERAQGAVLASDAFFPMPDGVERAVEAGIKAIIQPGGSKRDEDAIKAADDAGIVMAMTGVRHFKH